MCRMLEKLPKNTMNATDSQDKIEIKNLPTGEYVLVIWNSQKIY